jgi:CHAD domain-containing protein
VAEGKWIEGLTASTPVPDAARAVLAARLGVVRHYAPLAVEHAGEDIEHVHQLRVATRRAGAALRIFADSVPNKPHRAARKVLRRYRRAAGDARDWDVFIEYLPGLRALKRADARPAFDFLLGYATGQRAAAQVRLKEVDAEWRARLDRICADLPDEVLEPEEPAETPFGDLAVKQLGSLFAQLADAISGALAEYDELHQVRILGKRVRYAMEVFGDCFAPPFREELYPAVEEMQEILGDANDSHVAAGRLAALREQLAAHLPKPWETLRPGFDALIAFHERNLPKQRKRFLAWRSKWQELVTKHPLESLRVSEARP